MPKIYDNPKGKREQTETQGDHKRDTMGSGPATPSAQTDNRITMVAIMVALAIAIIVLLYRMAGG